MRRDAVIQRARTRSEAGVCPDGFRYESFGAADRIFEAEAECKKRRDRRRISAARAMRVAGFQPR